MLPRVLLLEPSASAAQMLRGYLTTGGFEVEVVRTELEAQTKLRAPGETFLFITSGPLDAEGICRRMKVAHPEVPVALLFHPDEGSAESRSSSASADACLVGPLKQSNVVSLAKLLRRVRAAPKQAEAPSPPTGLVAGVPAGSMEVEFFHRFLEMEIRRARRYAYPVALVALALDNPATVDAGASLASLAVDAREQLARGIRDTDCLVEAADGHFLVLLPYTSLVGAQGVAERLRSRLFGLQGTSTTATAGLAAVDPAGAATQNADKLLRVATRTLRLGQAEGGDRVALATLE